MFRKLFRKFALAFVIMVSAVDAHTEGTADFPIQGKKNLSYPCADFHPYATSCNICELGSDLPETSSKKAILSIYNTLENLMPKNKLVLFMEDFKYTVTPLEGDTVIVSNNLFEFPPENSFFTAKDGRAYTYIDPGKKVTIIRAKAGYGIELSKLAKAERHPAVKLEMSYRFYDSPEYGKLTNPRVHKHCIFYYAGK